MLAYLFGAFLGVIICFGFFLYLAYKYYNNL